MILSHGNIASDVCAVRDLIPFGSGDRSLSFLPWAHSFGHTGELHVMLTVGASMALSESVDKIVANLAEVHPTVLMSVPRIFNRIYEGVQKQMTEKPAVIQGLFRAGLRAATKQNKGEPLHLVERLTLAVADRVIFSKIRAKFGGKLKYAISGGAALSYQVAEFVDALGITIYEGYGLTETTAAISVNTPDRIRVGSVGRPLEGHAAKIGEDGELLLAAQLPPLAGDQVYQLWTIAGQDTPVSAGVFTVDSGGYGVLALGPGVAVPGVTLAVTPEPGPNGSPAPTGDVLIDGELDGELS